MWKDYTGTQVGKLLILRRAPDHGPGKWWVRCYCGKEFVQKASEIVLGKIYSCGCYKAERARSLCHSMKRILVPVEVTAPDGSKANYESMSAAVRAIGIANCTAWRHVDKTPIKGYVIRKITQKDD